MAGGRAEVPREGMRRVIEIDLRRFWVNPDFICVVLDAEGIIGRQDMVGHAWGASQEKTLHRHQAGVELYIPTV
jgi:hypothetical protein